MFNEQVRIGTGAIRNAAEIAQKLYGEYGELLGVTGLGLADLQGRHGIGLSKAMQLKSAIELNGQIIIDPCNVRSENSTNHSMHKKRNPHSLSCNASVTTLILSG